jgi:anthranilate phosphoribosyltransferase
MIKDSLKKLVKGIDLSEEEARDAMMSIMSGEATGAQIGSFLTALRMKGESISEITGLCKGNERKSKQDIS